MTNKWFSHSGLLMTCKPYTRLYTKNIKAHMPGATFHMRIGRFSVVIGNSDVVAAQVYVAKICDDGSIKKNSQMWARHRLERLSQCDRVQKALRADHPLYADIMSDIASERQHWG